MSSVSYPVVRNRPVASFRYKGNHSKPVRRTVLITDLTRATITGYEIREGNNLRDMKKAPVKSFARDKILDLERLAMCETTDVGGAS